MIAALRRYRALPAADRRLVAEAGVLLVLVRVGLLVLPFATVRRLVERHAGTPQRPDPGAAARASLDETPQRVAWAIGALSRRAPGPTTCLAQALVADTLLRRRGHPSCLRIGVREPGRGTAGPLRAHAWVECGGVVVVGGLDDLAEYAILASPERP